MSHRPDRVADLVWRELADVLLRRVHDGRVRQASISGVRLTPDLKRAIISVSVVGDDNLRSEILAALDGARGFLRNELARRLRGMKTTPDLRFELDRGPEHSQHIEQLLEQLHEEE